MGARIATLAEESSRNRRQMLAFLGFDGNRINISSSRTNRFVERYFYLLLHSLCLFLLTYSHTSHTLASSTSIITKNRVGLLITSEYFNHASEWFPPLVLYKVMPESRRLPTTTKVYLARCVRLPFKHSCCLSRLLVQPGQPALASIVK